MTWIIILVALMIIAGVVQSRLKSKFDEYSKVPAGAGLTGKEVAEKMLRDNHIHDVKVVSVPGRLSDHYNPKDKTVNLSPDVFNGTSVASAAVAAHECGHAVQHATSYSWLTMRSALVPVVGFSSKLMNIILFMAIFGVGLNYIGYTTAIYALIAAQAVLTAFALVTLPVEYDASNRALVWLEEAHITSPATHDKAKDALKWAARTYLISAISSIITLLYFVSMLMRE